MTVWESINSKSYTLLSAHPFPYEKTFSMLNPVIKWISSFWNKVCNSPFFVFLFNFEIVDVFWDFRTIISIVFLPFLFCGAEAYKYIYCLLNKYFNLQKFFPWASFPKNVCKWWCMLSLCSRGFWHYWLLFQLFSFSYHYQKMTEITSLGPIVFSIIYEILAFVSNN
jgi:hypothetical protein